MNHEGLIEAQQQAAAALSAGERLAQRMGAVGDNTMSALARTCDDPAMFWTSATAITVRGAAQLEAIHCSIKRASAALAVGDYAHVREALLGQATWLSTVAVTLMARVENTQRLDRVEGTIRLALAAQRQAAQALCSAAALSKLNEAESVSVCDH